MFLVKKAYLFKLFILVIILLISVFWSLGKGSTEISFNELYLLIFDKNTLSEESFFILYNLRLPRVLLAIIAGASLGVSGMVLQGLFRNPLVDPFIIGVSGGASLGAGIAILFGINFVFLGISAIPIIAFSVSMLCMVIAYSLSIINKRIYIDRLLLSGVAISSLSSSILSLFLVLKGQDANAVIFWIMGGLSGKTWDTIGIVLPYVIISNLIIIFNLQKLNILQFGDEEAENLGININRIKILLIFISCLLSAAIVSVSGIIGFIGLIVPQITRLLIKSSDFRLLYPYVIVLGATLLLLSDTVSRLILAPQEIPVGIFTALMGVPFFLLLLKKNNL